MTRKQIFAEVLSLDPDEREKLTDEIWLVTHGATHQQIDEEWSAEIRRRVEAMERGEGSSKPVEEVIQRLREKQSP